MADANQDWIGGKTVLGAGWLIAWRMVTRAIGFASTLILARILAPSDFGLVAMATTVSGLIDGLSELGVGSALIRRHDIDSAFYDTAFTFQVIRGVATGVIVALSAPAASVLMSEPRLVAILLALAVLSIFSAFENIGIVDFRRNLWFSMEFLLQLAPRLLQLAVTIPAALILHTYWALVIGMAGSKLTRLGMTYVVHSYRPRFVLSRWRDLAGFSFWTWAGSLATLLWERCDAFILGPVLGSAGFGIFTLAAEIAILPISELVAPAASALFPGLAILQRRGVSPASVGISIASTLLLIVMPLTLAVSGTSGYIVAAILGPKWAVAQPLIAIFAWLCIFSPFSYVCSTVLITSGHVRQNFIAVAAAGVIKASVLFTLSRLTHSMEMFATVGVCCVAAESSIFISQMPLDDTALLRRSVGGLLRIGFSALVTGAVLFCSGSVWRPVSLPSVTALIGGALIGISTIGIFVVVQFAQWLAFGRSDGPEARIIAILTQLLRVRIVNLPRRSS